jgi:uncharacterized protein (DUF302 family)
MFCSRHFPVEHNSGRSHETLYIPRRPHLVIDAALALVVLGLIMAGYLIIANPKALAHASIREEKLMATSAENGIVRIPGNHPVDKTVTKLKGILQAKSVKLFVVVDHSGEAAAAGLRMPNTKLLIFGNPEAGTPLMVASPGVALDFPLKILVAEDAEGKTWISYNSPAYLQARHRLPAELLPNICLIEALAAKAAE